LVASPGVARPPAVGGPCRCGSNRKPLATGSADGAVLRAV